MSQEDREKFGEDPTVTKTWINLWISKETEKSIDDAALVNDTTPRAIIEQAVKLYQDALNLKVSSPNEEVYLVVKRLNDKIVREKQIFLKHS